MTLPVSDHFNGKTFFNPGERAERGLLDVVKWKMTSRATQWPEHVDVVPRPVPAAPVAGVAATWVGHATFVLRTAQAVILTDPVFSPRAGPGGVLGPTRTMDPGVAFETLPKVDLVLLSHDHYDHCDVPTLRRLARRDDPLIIAPARPPGIARTRRLQADRGTRLVAEPCRVSRARGHARPLPTLEPQDALGDEQAPLGRVHGEDGRQARVLPGGLGL